MARATKKHPINDAINENIITDNLEEILGQRFGRYSKYIIQDRALPDARDGLKPVQRRILYAMYKLGMFSNSGYRKSARIVGEVIGKYHPHGDTSVYDAMVRLSQNFKNELPLIDMHGNNGSIDGDSAAAMRYTEARLSVYAECLLEDINKKTVGFVPNFDDEELEPVVLPAKYPNLLVNGASGIAAGYATEIPPHNIDEIIAATIHRINNPNCTLKDLMKIVQGPDFPTGGIVQGIDGIKSAYKTGRGKIIVKSKTEIVSNEQLNQLIITEIPFGVNKAQMVRKMSDVIKTKNVDGILDIRDESDREGLRVVVDIKKNVDPESIRQFFFKTTDLQISYNFNMVAINNKSPRMMGLIDLLDCYIAHQKEVITNRSNFELAQAKKRLHIVDGLILMVSILDAVIKTIRESLNKKDAKENIIDLYGFTEAQAEAIVTLQLYRLTNTDIVALQNEKKELEEKVEFLISILDDEKLLMEVVKKELVNIQKKLSMPRKTVIEHEIDELDVEVKALIPKEDTVVIVTHDGYIKRINPKNYQHLGEDETTNLKENDVVYGTYKVTTLDTILLFTTLGNYVFLPVQNIPEVKHKDIGNNISTLVNMSDKERIVFVYPVSDFDEERYLLFTTKSGLIKRTLLKDMLATRYSKALKATKLTANDEIVSVDIRKGTGGEVLIVTKEGFMSRYDADEVSIYAPASCGVKAIELKGRNKDEVITGKYVEPKDLLICLTNKGVIKRFRVDEIVKGHKNNVGKQYVTPTKTTSNDIIFSDIIKKKHLNTNPDCYLFGDKGFTEIDYAMLKGSSTSAKKINAQSIGKPLKVVIARNDFKIKK